MCLILIGLFAFSNDCQIHASGMLDEWEENLAIITANRTKDDELVMTHLGDCLWKEREEVFLTLCVVFILLPYHLCCFPCYTLCYIVSMSYSADKCCTHMLLDC